VLLQVARCSNADPTSKDRTPCSTIVHSQRTTPALFHVPEPWRGDIASAPLLFVSSNPSWNANDDSPPSTASDDEIVDYYNQGFPSAFPRNLMKDSQPGRRAVAFWAAIRARAAELYDCTGTSLVAGKDFALTEVVHCKSRNEIGVKEAASECVTRHFDAIVRLSPARVVVVLGKVARQWFDRTQVAIPSELDWHGRRRWLVPLPHPNARESRTFAATYDAEQLARLREAMKQAVRTTNDD
jgi:hypothetical protein